MQHFWEILFTIIPILLFLYLSLTMLGVIKYNSQTAFLQNASTTTKIAVYGGTIAFIIMAIKELL